MKKDIIFRMMNIDPCISRNEKILFKFCPKFLDLYAGMYGNLFSPLFFGLTFIGLQTRGFQQSSSGTISFTQEPLAKIYLYYWSSWNFHSWFHKLGRFIFTNCKIVIVKIKWEIFCQRCFDAKKSRLLHKLGCFIDKHNFILN